MAQCNLSILDTKTGFWITTYNQDPFLCGWGNASDCVCFDSWTTEDFDSFLLSLNYSVQTDNRFIGQNPPPR